MELRIINPCNVILFMANLSIYLFVYLFKYNLHFFLNNGMIRKIRNVAYRPHFLFCESSHYTVLRNVASRPIVFYYSYCLEKLYRNQLQGVK